MQQNSFGITNGLMRLDDLRRWQNPRKINFGGQGLINLANFVVENDLFFMFVIEQFFKTCKTQLARSIVNVVFS